MPPMKQEQSDKKHLSPRQIINRYRKGEYVEESIEAISSAISSCDHSFDSVAVPFQTTIIETVYENIDIAKTLYDRQKEGIYLDDIDIPDYPQLKELLIDLSFPPLWESMKEKASVTFIDIMKEQGFVHKYHAGVKNLNRVTTVLDLHYSDAVKQLGLSITTFSLVLNFMLK